jgi:hypothetical protein
VGALIEGRNAVLEALRSGSPVLYARVSEVSPEEGGTFRVFDRELRAPVLLDPADAASKWTSLVAIADAEQYGAGSIEYADLRFANRVVVKPRAGQLPASRGIAARTGNAMNAGAASAVASAGNLEGVKD